MRRLISTGLLLAVTSAALTGCGDGEKTIPPTSLAPAPKEPPNGARGMGLKGGKPAEGPKQGDNADPKGAPSAQQ